MDSEMKRLGWTEICCICGRNVISYHNPDPLRDGGGQNCCDACNRLVAAARIRISGMPKDEQKAYTRMIRDLPLESLKGLLYPS